MTDESSGKGNPHKNVQIFEVVAPKPNEDGVHDVLEQENLATLKNVASAIEILNRLKQK